MEDIRKPPRPDMQEGTRDKIWAIYERLEYISEGVYGRVYKAIHKITGQLVAIKVTKTELQRFDGSRSEQIPQTVLRELDAARKMKHPNLVKLLDFHLRLDPTFRTHISELVFEYFEYDLDRYIRTFYKNGLPQALAEEFIWQIIEGVRYMHLGKVWHRDLKPQNILVDHVNFVVKIADFGLSKTINCRNSQISNEVQSLSFRAPEVLLGSIDYDETIDSWSIGCIIYRIVTGRPLFQSDTEIGTIFDILKVLGSPSSEDSAQLKHLPYYKKTFPKYNHDQKIFDAVPGILGQLMRGFLQLNPSKRLKVYHALKLKEQKNS